MKRLIIDRRAGGIAAAKRKPERLGTGPLPPQCRDRGAGATGRREAFPEIEIKDRMRADLDKRVETLGQQPLDGGGEQYGKANILPPILGIEPVIRDRRTGNGRDKTAMADLRRQPLQPIEQLVPDRFHGAAVKGIVERQWPKEDRGAVEIGTERRERIRVA